MRRALASAAACLSVGFCQTTTAMQPVCLPLTPYSAGDQAQAAAELGALPPASVLGRFVVDYGRMREADRACLAAAKP